MSVLDLTSLHCPKKREREEASFFLVDISPKCLPQQHLTLNSVHRYDMTILDPVNQLKERDTLIDSRQSGPIAGDSNEVKTTPSMAENEGW